MSLIFLLNGHFIYHLHLTRVVWLLMLHLTCCRMVIFHVFLTYLHYITLYAWTHWSVGSTEFIRKLECVEAILASSSVQALKKYLHFSTIMWEEDLRPAKEHLSALPVLPHKHRRDGPQLMFTLFADLRVTVNIVEWSPSIPCSLPDVSEPWTLLIKGIWDVRNAVAGRAFHT